MTVIGRDFIFIHVPKCAGKSLSRRLGGVTRNLPGHAPLTYFSPEIRAGKFSFGFVRNPWDRMVSAYVFITTKRPRPADDPAHREMAASIGFRRWLLETDFFLGQDEYWRTIDLPPFQRRSQMFWLEGCEFIGRTETIDADMKFIEQHIGRASSFWYKLRYGGAVQRRNITHRSDYRHYFDDDTTAFIAKHFAPEIARFGYTFDPAT